MAPIYAGREFEGSRRIWSGNTSDFTLQWQKSPDFALLILLDHSVRRATEQKNSEFGLSQFSTLPSLRRRNFTRKGRKGTEEEEDGRTDGKTERRMGGGGGGGDRARGRERERERDGHSTTESENGEGLKEGNGKEEGEGDENRVT